MVFILFGCSATRETNEALPRPAQPAQPAKKAPLAEYERSFHPSDYDEDVKAAEKRAPVEHEQPEIESSGDSLRVQEEIVQGFRIQIFASARIDEATLAKQTAAQAITTDSLYIVYDPPVYKVRVGDYATRLDANRALVPVIQRGYPDAWIVTDRIVQRKFVRVPREEY
ncbi:MAG TPA: SPOR domain-containing protein [Bacteroidota bacterium]